LKINNRAIAVFLIFIFLIWAIIPSIIGDGDKHLNQDKLDQEQTIATIYEDIYDEIQVIQTFKPSLTTLTRIQLFLKRYGDLSGNLSLILLDNLMGYPIIQVTKPASDIDIYQRDWIEFDFNDIEVEIGKTYFIKLKLGDGDLYNYVRWHGSEINTYLDGYKAVSNNNGSTWIQYLSSDCCFRTYGVAFHDFEITYLKGGSGAKIEFGIKNTGVGVLDRIYAELNLNTLITLTGNTNTKIINASLQPGESLNDVFSPVIGFGPATITLKLELDDGTDREIKKGGFLFLFYIYIKP